MYLSTKTDAKIKSGKFLLTKRKWSENENNLLFDKAYLFNLNNTNRQGINGKFIFNSSRFEKGNYKCKYIIKLENNVKIKNNLCNFKIE